MQFAFTTVKMDFRTLASFTPMTENCVQSVAADDDLHYGIERSSVPKTESRQKR
jgi:hypothetical protein